MLKTSVSIKANRFYGKRASDVLATSLHKFLEKSAKLESAGIAGNLRVFGSIAKGTDTEQSDIDFWVDVTELSPRVYVMLEQAPSDWSRFPVHITMDDGSGIIPENIVRESVKL